MTAISPDGYGLFGNQLPPRRLTDTIERSRLSRPAEPDLVDLVKLGAERKTVLDFELEEIPDELLALLENDLVAELKRDKRAAATREKYKSDFVRFKKYAEGHGLPYLPASPAAVAYFLLHDVGEAASLGYVYRVLSAVAYVHELRMLANPCRTPLVRAARRYLMRARQAFAEAEALPAASGESVEAIAAEHEHGETANS
jgi:hypothetical protein